MGRYLRFSYPRFLRLQEALGDDGQLAGTTLSTRFVGRLQGSPQASPMLTQLVTGLYFATLGAEMQRGRPITDSDMQRDERAHVAVISDGYWKRALGGTEQALGQTILIRGVALTVVGIARADFVGVRTDSVADLWVPITLQDSLQYSTNRSDYGSTDASTPWMDEDRIAWLNLVARVPASRRAQAITRLQNTNAQGLQQLAEGLPDAGERKSTLGRSLVVMPFERGFSALRSRFSDALYALATMVGIVLLVTCANIANLLLARATGRSREISIRLSLGATTGRLVRQHLAESLLLAGAGGAMSVLAAQWTSEFMARAGPGSNRRASTRVLARRSRVDLHRCPVDRQRTGVRRRPRPSRGPRRTRPRHHRQPASQHARGAERHASTGRRAARVVVFGGIRRRAARPHADPLRTHRSRVQS